MPTRVSASSSATPASDDRCAGAADHDSFAVDFSTEHDNWGRGITALDRDKPETRTSGGPEVLGEGPPRATVRQWTPPIRRRVWYNRPIKQKGWYQTDAIQVQMVMMLR